ncbi:MAG TPA: GNAT family N-acetyltransferase [Capsulimonadaceae bacterium]|jgi:GNAT superfamily N-acetyltransferase
MLYRLYEPSDACDIVTGWNRIMHADFPLDLRLWQQNVDGCAWTFEPGCWLAFDDAAPDAPILAGFVVAKSPGNVSAIGVLPEYQRRGVGRELLQRAVGALRSDAGRTRAAEVAKPNDPPANLITGQDVLHFFPGVPDTHADALAFFAACGWTESAGWCIDLTRNLTDFQIAPEVQATIARLAADGIEIRECRADDVPSLLQHVEENFSPRWLFETRGRTVIEPDPSEIKIAVRDGKVIGFAQTFTSKSHKLGPSVYWRELLGPAYGGLGPIGVAKDVRKIGLGLALLSYSVNAVREAGMDHMAIDWTVLADFYGKVGFKQWKRYIPFNMPVAP